MKNNKKEMKYKKKYSKNIHAACERRIRFDTVYAEDMDFSEKGVHKIIGELIQEWVESGNLDPGFYPLIGMMILDPKNGMSLELISPSFTYEKKSDDPERHSYDKDEVPDDPFDKDQDLTNEKISDFDPCEDDLPDEENDDQDETSEDDRGYSIVQEMIADMDSLKGTIHAAQQMMHLTKRGIIGTEQEERIMRLYCLNANHIVEKWKDLLNCSF